jgi:hypothetical protein
MIKKWIKSFIEKFFGKFCKCQDESLILNKEVKSKPVCEKHPDSYKKTCPFCRELVSV